MFSPSRIKLAILALCTSVLLITTGATKAWVRNSSTLPFYGSVLRSTITSAAIAALPSDHPRRAIWSAMWLLQSNKPHDAVQLLTRSASTSGDSLVSMVLADAYARAGSAQQAVAILGSRRDHESLLREGHKAWQANRLDDAILFFEAAWNLDPFASAVPLAQALADRQDAERAEAILRRMLANYPKRAESESWRDALGGILENQNRWQEALNVYTEALDFDPSDPSAHIGLGQSLYYSGQGIAKATAEVERGIALQPSKPTGYAAMGDLLRAEKRYMEAADWYGQASERDPGNVWIAAREVDALMAANQVSVAVELLNLAIQRFPTQPHLYYQLGEAYKREGNMKLAIPAAQASVSLDRSGNAGYRLALAELYEQAGQFPEALEMYRAALTLDPNLVEAQVGLRRAQR